MPRVFSKKIALCAVLCSLLLAAGAAPGARADSSARKAADFGSGAGNILYLAAAVGLPLIEDHAQGRNNSLRVADSIGSSVLIAEGLKCLVREKRPDSNEHDSFPSGHATAAFAAATAESALHPKQAVYWYTGAALISYTRIRLNRHHPQDVVAGALLGYGIAKWEIASPRGLILAPIIEPKGHGAGLQVSASWR